MSTLFEDTFNIKTKDAGGKRFDKVSRFYCSSSSYEIDLYLDINVDIYPLEEGQRVHMALAPTLNMDGSSMGDSFTSASAAGGKASLADKYEYVMFGRVFKFIEDKAPSQKVSVIASFGGLLMALKGDARHLTQLELDSNVFLLLRRT
eukprot:m51a1_g7119 putative rna polymerase ii core subunit (148) ;mRNA; r:117562-118224